MACCTAADRSDGFAHDPLTHKLLERVAELELERGERTPVFEAALALVKYRDDNFGNPSNPDWWRGGDWQLVREVDIYRKAHDRSS